MSNPKFALLFWFEPAAFKKLKGSKKKEYDLLWRQWLMTLGHEDVIVSGDLFDKDRTYVGVTKKDQTLLSGASKAFTNGIMIVTALNLEHAQKIAGDCPDIQFGGYVEIRRID